MSDHQDAHSLKIGVMGCGAIGSRIAESIHESFHPFASLSGVYDIDAGKRASLAGKFKNPLLEKASLKELLDCADLIVEAVYAPDTPELLKEIIRAGKDLLVMSAGSLLDAGDLFEEARIRGCHMIVPSGAVAGIDAIRAAARAGIDTITLTTYKPPSGLKGAPYLIQNNISIDAIKEETLIFEGDVYAALAAFPQNINVAATVALAANAKDTLRIRIITSPEFQYNRHEIHTAGVFGQITTVTENLACPDNPNTSYLAVLSGLEALRSFCQTTKIGT